MLSDAEIDLLCKGASFCTPPSVRLWEFNDDLYDFTRKLRLCYDSFNFLNYNSCHSRHTGDNTAWSLTNRIVRIVSFEEDRIVSLEELKQHLILRGRPPECIDYMFAKIISTEQKQHSLWMTSLSMQLTAKTSDSKQRIRKHKSDIKHPQNSNCRALAEHLRSCNSRNPGFCFYPIYNMKDRQRRRFV